mmetsp:Transcript_78597/g.139483  ORF Transcript_78597/g.139483 Transcript_78597/m.139483 type:complete len:477 (+) Transcript_78597:99-1529(+)
MVLVARKRCSAVGKSRAVCSMRQGQRGGQLKQVKKPAKLFTGRRKKLLQEHVAVMRKACRQGMIHGCATTVIHQGRVVYREAFGQSDLEHRKAFKHDSICRLYCQTKAYTLFVAGMLADKGLLEPDAPVSKYIPSMRGMTVLPVCKPEESPGSSPKIRAAKAKVVMRVRHLMTHTAGLGYMPSFGYPASESEQRYQGLLEGVASGRLRSLAAFVDELAKIPLLFEPGLRYEYGHSIDVLGRVLEVASGKDLAALMQEALFKPLGMHDTGFSVARSKLARLSGLYGNAKTWGYLYGSVKGAVPSAKKPGLVRIDGASPKESKWAAGRTRVLAGGGYIGDNEGGLVSTVKDTEAFVHMLLARGCTPDGTRLISESTLSQMERNQLVGSWRPRPWNPVGGQRWCMLGDMVKDDRSLYYQQGGAGGNYFLVDRRRDLGIIMYLQQVDGDEWETLGVKPERAEIDQLMRAVVDEVDKSCRA